MSIIDNNNKHVSLFFYLYYHANMPYVGPHLRLEEEAGIIVADDANVSVALQPSNFNGLIFFIRITYSLLGR